MFVVFEMLIVIAIVVIVYMFITGFFSVKNRNDRIIKKSKITQEQWDNAYSSLPLLNGLTEVENKTLKELTILFIHNKAFEGAQGFEVTPNVLLTISLQACLPILRLGLDCYNNFSTIIIYPSGFRTNRKVTDENGIVDHDRSHTLGEAWLGGPVILSWSDAERAGIIDGDNLIIHEFAHKLDMQNGVANGFPPLPNGLKPDDWVSSFTKAYEYFEKKCTGNKLHDISCYAATSPAEFFSVFSEVFFERPDRIKKYFPEVNTLLELYYRQSPIIRLTKK